MKLEKLKINPDNPQKFDDLSKLKNSIKEFPKMMSLRPLVYDPSNGVVLGGNKRLICLQELDYKEIPDEWAKPADKLTEEEMKRFIIADNVGFGEWDWDKLESWDSEELEEWGLDMEEYSVEDIDEVGEINEVCQFVIQCKDIDELETLKHKLSTTGKAMKSSNFIELL